MPFPYNPFSPYMYVAYLPYHMKQFQQNQLSRMNPKQYVLRYRPTYTHNRQPLEPKLFMKSASEGKALLDESRKIVDRISSDKAFAKEMMEAARNGNITKVNRLIAETGVEVSVEITFDPDGIRFELKSESSQQYYSKLTLYLRWQVPPYV